MNTHQQSAPLRQALLLAALLALSPALYADALAEGFRAHAAGNYAQARQLWLPLAEQNDPDALFNIGLLYMLGQGVEQNDRAALDWFKRAAEHGSIDAAYNLGSLYIQGRGVHTSTRDALYWWRQSAALGHAESQFNLGVLYAYGRGTGRNTAEAIRLWEQAARQGNRDALKALIQTYREGLLDIPPSPAQAQHWQTILDRLD